MTTTERLEFAGFLGLIFATCFLLGLAIYAATIRQWDAMIFALLCVPVFGSLAWKVGTGR